MVSAEHPQPSRPNLSSHPTSSSRADLRQRAVWLLQLVVAVVLEVLLRAKRAEEGGELGSLVVA